MKSHSDPLEYSKGACWLTMITTLFQVGQAPRGSFAAWEVTFKSGNLTRRQQAVLRLGTVGDLRSGRVRESEGGGEEAEIAQL